MGEDDLVQMLWGLPVRHLPRANTSLASMIARIFRYFRGLWPLCSALLRSMPCWILLSPAPFSLHLSTDSIRCKAVNYT